MYDDGRATTSQAHLRCFNTALTTRRLTTPALRVRTLLLDASIVRLCNSPALHQRCALAMSCGGATTPRPAISDQQTPRDATRCDDVGGPNKCRANMHSTMRPMLSSSTMAAAAAAVAAVTAVALSLTASSPL